MTRFAFVTTTVHRRAELSRSPIDAEWLLANRDRFTPIVLVDHESAGSHDLRDAGIQVFVSAKRTNVIPGGVTLSADHIQARLLNQSHRADPLDFIIYSSSATTDLAWFERPLAGVPRGVTLGDGILGDLRVIASDAALFENFGRRCWASTGFLAAADFVVADAPAGSYGFKEADLPARYTTGLFDDLAPPTIPAEPPTVMVIVATCSADLEFATLLPSVLDRVPVDERTINVVIHRDVTVGPEHARDLILEGCPSHLRESTILVAPRDDGTAAAFLEIADWVVAAGWPDMAIPAVAAAARRTGYTVLDPAPFEDASPLPDKPVKAHASGHCMLVPVDKGPVEVVDVVDRLFETADFVVLHEPGFAAEARRFIGMPGLAGVDLAALAYPGPVFGLPEARHLNLHLLGVGGSAWPSVRRRALRASSLFELATWCADLSLAEHVRLLVLPGTGDGCQPISPDHVPGLPTWVTSNGLLPQPNLVDITRIPSPIGGPDDGAGMEDWIATRGWSDRARLALPWKGGLLERAMRGRW